MRKKFFILTPSLINSELWQNSCHSRRSLIITCLAEANHEDHSQDGVVVPRGSFKTSYRKLALLCSLKLRTLRDHLAFLSTARFTAHLTAHKYLIVSVLKYNDLQENSYEGPPTLPHNEPHTTASQTAQSVRLGTQSYSNITKPFNHKNILDLIKDRDVLSRYRKDFPWDQRDILKDGLLKGFQCSEAEVGKVLEAVYPEQYTGKAA